jgi:hypothetical protein
MIARSLDPKFNIAPETTAEWKNRVEKVAAARVAVDPESRLTCGSFFFA